MADLPTGAVTLLFTDIEGSTRLLTERGEGYAAALAEHRRKLREAFARNRGVEVDTQGDAFFCAFVSAKDALAAARDAQESLGDGPVRVRIGIHTGEPQLTGEGYVGIDVHKGARICATAHGGQVVLSERTRGLLGADFLVADLGLHRLKDFDRPERLFQLGSQAFPPLRSLNASNLPAQIVALIGRGQELEDLRSLARQQRLVTVTGTGGSGKTTLALHAVGSLTPEFNDGVFWVPLATIRDPDLVVPTVELTLGAKVSLAEHINEKRTCLLLDNLEQVIECAAALAELLSRCCNLHLVVTSRAPLRLSGEVEYWLGGLPNEDAVGLFCARSGLAEPRQVIAEICRRLGGLPLAIELAAVRTRMFAPPELLRRLEQSLAVLVRGTRGAPERQRTLRATIEWSHDLLSPSEQLLFARLAVFSGGFTLDAAEEVCDADANDLESLIEQNLVQRAGERCSMLETIREYAAERLEAAGEGEAVRRRHAEYLVEIARKARWFAIGFDWQRQKEGLAVLDLERDNVHAAVQWTLDRGSGLALSLTAPLFSWWLIRGTRRQGLAWLEQALALPPRDASPDRAEALTGAALLARLVGDFARARQFAEEAIEAGRAAESPVAVVTGLNVLVTLAGRAGDFDRASAHCTQSVQAARAAGSMRLEALALFVFAETALHAGRYADARHAGGRALELFRATGDQEGMALALARLGLAAVHEGRLREAATQLDEALECVNLLGFAETGAWCCEGLALVAARSGEPLRAARLLGAAETLRQVGGGVVQPAEAAAREQALAAIAHGLRDHELAAALEAGRRLSLDVAVAEARGVAAAATG